MCEGSIPRIRVTGQGSQVRGKEAQVMAQESVVKGHSQGSLVRGQDQRSWVTGQWSRVTGQSQGSLVSSQGSLVRVKCHWSVVKGHWSVGSLVKPFSIIRPYTNPIGINDILKTINFQVRDLDLQAMGGSGDGTEKNFGPISIIRPYMNPIHPRVWK